MTTKHSLQDISAIPKGLYCYEQCPNNRHRILFCQFWRKIPNAPYQQDGYCKFMEYGDTDSEYLSLLWDGCKECGINEGLLNEDDI